jgi:molybdate transport system substrate-binding protein
MPRFAVPALLILLAGIASADARELKILTGAGMSMPVRALAAAYGTRTGSTVTVVSDTAGGVQKRIEAGEKFDLVIGTQAVLDALTKESKVSTTHSDLAQMVAGIGAKLGAPKPAITDSAQFKALLLAAKNITYVDPASGGITGVFFLSQADKLGVGQEVRAKAVLKPNGTSVAEAVARGEAQYGVTLISEMLPNPGVTVWPLPDDLQMTTIYTAAITNDAQNAMDAQALLDDLRGLKGHDASIKAGLKPVSH